jgi:hypothetical protein
MRAVWIPRNCCDALKDMMDPKDTRHDGYGIEAAGVDDVLQVFCGNRILFEIEYCPFCGKKVEFDIGTED